MCSCFAYIEVTQDITNRCNSPQRQSVPTTEKASQVLILMDGYDEYEPGTNREADTAIERTQGNCLLLLTSRPRYLKKHIRDKMDGEIIIHGFSKKNHENMHSIVPWK